MNWENPLEDIRDFRRAAGEARFVSPPPRVFFRGEWQDFSIVARDVFIACGRRGGSYLRCTADSACRRKFRLRGRYRASYRRHLRRGHGIEPVA